MEKLVFDEQQEIIDMQITLKFLEGKREFLFGLFFMF